MAVETIAAVELDLWNLTTEAVETLRYAERTFTTRATDTPALATIRGRLIGPVEIERGLRARPDGFFGSIIDVEHSAIVLDNTDGGLDALLDGYEPDGREVRVLVGTVAHLPAAGVQPAPEVILWAVAAGGADTLAVSPGGDDLILGVEAPTHEVAPWYDPDEVEPYDDFVLAWRGVAGQWEPDGEELLRLRLKDPGIALQGQLQLAAFAGDGAREGTAEVQGVTKPLAFGYLRNVPLVLIDGFNQVYAVHAGWVDAFESVRDRGVVVPIFANSSDYGGLTLLTIPPGQCATCRAEGLVRFETTPSLPTAWLWGEASPPGQSPWTFTDGVFWPDDGGVLTGLISGYVERAGEVIVRALAVYGRGPAHDGRINAALFAAFDAAHPNRIGWFLEAGGAATCEEVIEAIAWGVGAAVGPDRLLNYGILSVERPDLKAPVATFSERQILAVERLTLPYGAAPWRWRYGFNRNWRVQTGDDIKTRESTGDIAGTASDAFKEFAPHEYRYIYAEDTDGWRRNPSVIEPAPIAGAWTAPSAASADLATRFALYRPGRALYRIRVATHVLALEIGDVVDVTYRPDGVHTRLGLGAARLLVVRVRDSLGGDDTSCTFWGFG